MLMARGSAAMWHGAVATRTASAVVRPPRPPGPMPVAFTAASSSSSSARRRSSAAGSSTGRMSARFAKPATLSNVEPMPTPTTSGGQALAPFSRTQRTSSSTMPCLPAPGTSMTTRLALSEPPPFSITCSRAAPGSSTGWTSQNAGVLSPVFARSRTASRTTDLRRRASS